MQYIKQNNVKVTIYPHSMFLTKILAYCAFNLLDLHISLCVMVHCVTSCFKGASSLLFHTYSGEITAEEWEQAHFETNEDTQSLFGPFP